MTIRSVLLATAVAATAAVCGLAATIPDAAPEPAEILAMMSSTTCSNSRIDPNGALRHVLNPKNDVANGRNVSWIVSLCNLAPHTPRGTSNCNPSNNYAASWNISAGGVCLESYDTIVSVVPGGSLLVGGTDSILANVTLSDSADSRKVMFVAKCIMHENNVAFSFDHSGSMPVITMGHNNFCNPPAPTPAPEASDSSSSASSTASGSNASTPAPVTPTPFSSAAAVATFVAAVAGLVTLAL